MKTYKLLLTTVVLGLSLGQAMATNLDNPKGLALDSKGNLYVANPGRNTQGFGGSVLVYNPSFMQLPNKGIGGAGVNYPIGVAVNSKDQVYVANAGDWRITVYNGTVQDNTKTLTQADGIHSPSDISIDGMDNVWISDPTGLGDTNIDVFSANSVKLNSIKTADYVGKIAVSKHGPFFMTTSDFNQATRTAYAGEILTNKSSFFKSSGIFGESMTLDQNGKAYVAEFNGDVAIGDPKTHTWQVLFHVPYGASGIAVDNLRKRVYVASDDLNKIDVFSTAGVYLTTIQ